MPSLVQNTLHLLSQLPNCIHQNRNNPEVLEWSTTKLTIINQLQDLGWETAEIDDVIKTWKSNDQINTRTTSH